MTLFCYSEQVNAHEEHNETARCLLVRAGSELCAIPLAAVRRVVTPGKISPLPGAEAVLLGLTEFQGEPLPVLDLTILVGASPEAAPARPLMVVARTGRPPLTELVGLHADGALEIVEIDRSLVAAGGGGTVAGEVTVGDRTALLLDLDALGAPA